MGSVQSGAIMKRVIVNILAHVFCWTLVNIFLLDKHPGVELLGSPLFTRGQAISQYNAGLYTVSAQ